MFCPKNMSIRTSSSRTRSGSVCIYQGLSCKRSFLKYELGRTRPCSYPTRATATWLGDFISAAGLLELPSSSVSGTRTATGWISSHLTSSQGAILPYPYAGNYFVDQLRNSSKTCRSRRRVSWWLSGSQVAAHDLVTLSGEYVDLDQHASQCMAAGGDVVGGVAAFSLGPWCLDVGVTLSKKGLEFLRRLFYVLFLIEYIDNSGPVSVPCDLVAPVQAEVLPVQDGLRAHHSPASAPAILLACLQCFYDESSCQKSAESLASSQILAFHASTHPINFRAGAKRLEHRQRPHCVRVFLCRRDG